MGKLNAMSEVDSLILQLEYHMSNRANYDIEKQAQIRKLKDLKNNPELGLEQQLIINNRLIEEYEAFVFDSALFYLEENLELCKKIYKPDQELKTRILLADMLASSGRYKDAEDILNSIPVNQIPDDILKEYYKVYCHVYSIITFYTPINENRIKYSQLYKLYTDSLISVIDHNSEQYLAILEKDYRDSRQLDKCLDMNSQRLALTKFGERAYSMVTFERSLVYELLGDVQNQKKYLILSAISDISFSVKDNASLAVLAAILYHEQNLEKAYRFITFSYEDASFYNSSLRFTLISNILPIINDAYQLRNTKQKRALRNLLILISFLSIGLFITVILVYSQMKKLSKAQKDLKAVNNQLRSLNSELNDANSKLNESNKVKEHYIGNFLAICSNYIDKLDAYRKLVNRHISNKQINELFEKAKSAEFIDHEIKEFYDNFDTTFLHIFPNFVERINSFLADGEKIELKNDEILNTELRIFALIRLGINDSNRIATLLRYSVRTIYNYRVKIKNKAVVPRDDFEEFVMKIDAFSK